MAITYNDHEEKQDGDQNGSEINASNGDGVGSLGRQPDKEGVDESNCDLHQNK